MTDISYIAGACIALFFLLAVAAFAFAWLLLKRQSQEQARMIYQCDERLSAAWSFSEKLVARCWATRWPETSAKHRAMQGPIHESAQQRPKRGFDDAQGDLFPEDRVAALRARAQARIDEEQIGAQLDAMNQVPAQIPVATQLDFEQNGNWNGR